MMREVFCNKIPMLEYIVSMILDRSVCSSHEKFGGERGLMNTEIRIFRIKTVNYCVNVFIKYT
jgi:hypothetical protein